MWLMLIPLQAQDVCHLELSGTVYDETGAALLGASVVLSPTGHGQVTDGAGRFVFAGLCPGTYTVTIQFIGYKKYEFELILDKPVKRTVQLEAETRQLEEVTVQGILLNTEHAQNYTALSEEQLAEAAGKSLGETLREVPGVNTIQSGPGIFKPVIHGVHSQRVLILNHGIRLEGQQWGAEHAPEIDPFIASDIVVIKDASSIKYGTDALGGVIVVNPAPLPEQVGLGGTLQTVFQSNGRSGTVSGMLEGGITNHTGWGWRAQGTLKGTGDFHTPDYMLTNTGVREYDFSVATGYHKEHSGVELFFSRFQSELGILRGAAISNLDDLKTAMEREPPQYTADFSYALESPRQEVTHNLLKLSGHRETDHGTLRVQYGFQQNNRKEFDIRKGSRSDIPSINLRLFTHTLETEWETSRRNRSTCMGITGMMQRNDNIYGTQRIPFIPDFNSIAAGAYAIVKLTLDRWTVDAGTRYDYRTYSVAGYDLSNSLYHADMRFHNASATAGAVVRLSGTQSLGINLSTSWRPPHVAELYSAGTHQSAAANEYGLLLEDSTNEVQRVEDVSFENEQALKAVGTYQYAFGAFTSEVTGYANYIFNYIYLRPVGVTQTIRGAFPALRYTQTDALFLGVDVSVTWQPYPYLKIGSQASVLRASDESNHDRLVYIPPNRYTVSVRVEEPSRVRLKNFFAETKVKYTARQERAPRTIPVDVFLEGSEFNPFENDPSNFDLMAAPDGYWLLNLSSGFSIRTTKKVRYDLRLVAENLLNTSYREYTNRLRYYADDLGRNFIVSVKCIF